jgi:hypothetical protein
MRVIPRAPATVDAVELHLAQTTRSRSFSSRPTSTPSDPGSATVVIPQEVGLAGTTFELHIGDEVYGLTAEDGRFSV